MIKLSKICSGALLFAGLCIPSLSHAGSIKVEKIDSRPTYDFECQLDFDYNGNHYMDWQTHSGLWSDDKEIHWGVSVYSPNWVCGGGQCGGDGFYYKSENGTSGQRLIIDKEDNPQVYSNLVMQCWFKINGYWHYDWEDLGNWSGSGDINLVVDGCNASWDGTYWLGDLLRHTTLPPPPRHSC